MSKLLVRSVYEHRFPLPSIFNFRFLRFWRNRIKLIKVLTLQIQTEGEKLRIFLRKNKVVPEETFFFINDVCFETVYTVMYDRPMTLSVSLLNYSDIFFRKALTTVASSSSFHIRRQLLQIFFEQPIVSYSSCLLLS